ncbi:MAG: hypothetical protein SGJ21_11865 [Alphaproteobacteria bacterium]|nr:hypothetical protein [Alphaproteobacteria bacterium]
MGDARGSGRVNVLNLFDSDDCDIAYYYESRLGGEPANLEDIHVHSVDSLQIRLSFRTRFQQSSAMSLAFSRTSQRMILAGGLAVVMAVLILGREPAPRLDRLSDDTVVATLGSAATPYPPELRVAGALARVEPQNPQAALDAARAYLDYGRRIGDARFAGAALGALAPWLETEATPQALNVAASARQYRHDFTGAIALLDRALGLDPANAQALLSRANIHIVQGRTRAAAADCTLLAEVRRMDLAVLCDTTANALTAEAPLAYERLDRLAASRAIDPALRGYAHSLLAELARFQNWPDKARPHFEAALGGDPDDLRTRMIFVDFELAQGRPREALALLASTPATDSIIVRRAIANRSLGNSSETEKLSSILLGRIEQQAAAGESAHDREAARYWLDVAGDPQKALAASRSNWRSQRELEDALLLIASASAAGNPAAADPVVAWAKAEGVVAPLYLSAIARLEGAAR